MPTNCIFSGVRFIFGANFFLSLRCVGWVLCKAKIRAQFPLVFGPNRKRAPKAVLVIIKPKTKRMKMSMAREREREGALSKPRRWSTNYELWWTRHFDILQRLLLFYLSLPRNVLTTWCFASIQTHKLITTITYTSRRWFVCFAFYTLWTLENLLLSICSSFSFGGRCEFDEHEPYRTNVMCPYLRNFNVDCHSMTVFYSRSTMLRYFINIFWTFCNIMRRVKCAFD